MGKSVIGTENSVTYAEVHATILGGVVGTLVGYVSGIGFESVALGVGVVFVGIALGVGVRGNVPMAQQTIRREPWYALAAFLLGGAVGTLV